MNRPGEPVVVDAHCTKCGAVIISWCNNCGQRIRGTYTVPGVLSLRRYDLVSFCDGCGSPMPWATREDRIYQLENILDEQELDQASRLQVLEALEQLKETNLPEKDQKRLWTIIQKAAPGLINSGSVIVKTIVEAEIRQRLGLPV
jgi:hypothetical protein